jgi:RNA polymerase sigma-70 factor (ECF subfamily)
MATSQSDSDERELLQAAASGDSDAGQRLLAQHRGLLRQMVAVYLDHRLAARIDPSDVVQEALADAARGLSGYLRERPLPFYSWLRQFAWQRLLQLHRHHIRAQRRSVDREVPWDIALPDRSADALANRLLANGTSPSRRMMRDELRRRVQAAMDRLPERDRGGGSARATLPVAGGNGNRSATSPGFNGLACSVSTSAMARPACCSIRA